MMPINEKFGQLADQKRIDKTIAALNKNGVQTIVVENAAAAKEKLKELLPQGAGKDQVLRFYQFI